MIKVAAVAVQIVEYLDRQIKQKPPVRRHDLTDEEIIAAVTEEMKDTLGVEYLDRQIEGGGKVMSEEKVRDIEFDAITKAWQESDELYHNSWGGFAAGFRAGVKWALENQNSQHSGADN